MKSTHDKHPIRNLRSLPAFTCPKCGGQVLRQYDGTRTCTSYDISICVDSKSDPGSARILLPSGSDDECRRQYRRYFEWECGDCGTLLCHEEGSPLRTPEALAEWLVRNSPYEEECENLEFQCPVCGGKVLAVSHRISFQAVLKHNNQMELGGFNERQQEGRVFGCSGCEFVIEDENGPIREVSAAVEWLKQNCKQPV